MEQAAKIRKPRPSPHANLTIPSDPQQKSAKWTITSRDTMRAVPRARRPTFLAPRPTAQLAVLCSPKLQCYMYGTYIPRISPFPRHRSRRRRPPDLVQILFSRFRAPLPPRHSPHRLRPPRSGRAHRRPIKQPPSRRRKSSLCPARRPRRRRHRSLPRSARRSPRHGSPRRPQARYTQQISLGPQALRSLHG